MTSFRERNPFTIGVVGTVALAAVLTATFQYEELPIVGSGTTYRAEFGEAAGLQRDDEVRIAGMKVGEVTDVALAEDHVVVSFRVKDAWLGDRTSAEIKLKTLLGRKFLALRPHGQSTQDPNVPIPRERTVTPYDVTEAFSGLADTVGAIDTDQLAESFRVLSDTFAGAPEHVRTALDGLSALSTTIASRDAELAELLANTRAVSATLAGSSDEFERLIDDGNLLLAELDHRRESISALLTGTRRLAEQLSGLVADNRERLEPALRQLDTVTDVLRRQHANLQQGLRLAGPYFRQLNNAAGNGRWVDNYLCRLVREDREECTPPRGGTP
ncbi:phospholipid/cholesterol/gamma-HCH transport system substrate-binding protein [Amycolatopsis arida]|uniref:Phospholipid/cholesterol/gamma-HCH transport system substrate-binding protein n=1 Tax=Amycolatopsis arida TaxID=587909 RepID=A0A1I5K7X7_9PSEU|nr:MCE family protein [Amycolatopsis arida]TDX96910.1 phospholipid/cholesterol/gamma-HCH transport system substrate-binding protein [Amycolatopsis arida]SFO80706.1 phospholipid/cholesterol/gamma-HCH transport system substrate-binding protein [Amycolatopsis arida]